MEAFIRFNVTPFMLKMTKYWATYVPRMNCICFLGLVACLEDWRGVETRMNLWNMFRFTGIFPVFEEIFAFKFFISHIPVKEYIAHI